jgi:hypothetical protein
MLSPSRLHNKRPSSDDTDVPSASSSPSKILSSPISSLRTLFWSPSKEISSKENEELNPTPSKKQKKDIPDQLNSSSFITSSPQRICSKAATPKKKAVRNLNAEFDSTDSEPSQGSVTDENSSQSQTRSDDDKENTQSKTKQILNTLFSPMFKQYHHMFGINSVQNSHTVIHQENSNGVVAHYDRTESNTQCWKFVELPADDEESPVRPNAYLQLSVVELAANESLSDISKDSPEKTAISTTLLVEEQEEETTEEEIEEFDPYAFIATLPPLNPEFLSRPPALPSRTESHPKLTLVLDLDETLVHCSTEPIPNPELTFPVVFNDVEYQVFVKNSPFFHGFLEDVVRLGGVGGLC